MTREIKFRVWDSLNREMYLNIDVFNFQKNENGFCIPSRKFILEEFMECPSKEEIVVMQYTGLKDKNGKEVFEGDIISYEYDSDKKRGLLVYGKRIDTPLIVSIPEIYLIDKAMQQHEIEFKIVGNIYEHPNLLK